MSKIAYFISDVHLGIKIPGYENRQKDLLSFFLSLENQNCDLYINGDLFDFWIEYSKTIRSDYFIVCSKLKKLVDSGVTVHYLAGNHDFALGKFLTDVINLHIHQDYYSTEIQGKKVYLYHGDGLIKNDRGYRILKKILRNKFNQFIYKLIHPDIGIRLGSFFSGSSRKMLANWMSEEKLEEQRKKAKNLLSVYDIVLFGHTHKAEFLSFGEKTYVNTGEWIRNYTYAKMENGKISLWQWFPDKLPVQID